MKKYELVTPYTLDGVTMWRLRALRDIPQTARLAENPELEASTVKAGDLGGWVAGEQSLSQDGNCWVYAHAQVCDGARISGNALIGGDAAVTGHARVSGNARVGGSALVAGHAVVDKNACLRDWAQANGNAHITGNAALRYGAYVTGDVTVDGDTVLDEGRLGEVPSPNILF